MDRAATTYHSYKEVHVGQTSSKFLDLAIVYAILTPTAVLYWRTTDKLLPMTLSDIFEFEYRKNGAS